MNRLRADIEVVASETTLPIVVVGLLSPIYVDRLPEQVVVAAGLHQWLGRVAPREHDAVEIRHRYWSFAEEIDRALDRGGR